jgi:glycosyltransferase involved in cell wall biosynthesis
VNYESIHMLQEDGLTLLNLLRFIGKELGERRSARRSTVLAAITPAEARLYQRVAPRAQVHVLPLRTLPRVLRPPHPVTARRPLRVFSMGASYNVPHNRAALEFVVRQVVPRVRALAPGQFEFHIMGGKIPQAIATQAAPDLIIDGFVDDLETHLMSMDIALAPSRFGQGMQQKVFEPLCRAIPTVASRRALADYPFVHEQHALLADAPDDAQHAEQFAAHIARLADPVLRQRLAEGASTRAAALFSQPEIDHRLTTILEAAIKSHTPA